MLQHTTLAGTQPQTDTEPPWLTPAELRAMEVEAVIDYLQILASEMADTMTQITLGVRQLESLGLTPDQLKATIPATVWGVAVKVEAQEFGTA